MQNQSQIQIQDQVKLYDYLQTSIVELLASNKTNANEVIMILNNFQNLDKYKHSGRKETLLERLCLFKFENNLFEIIDYIISRLSSNDYYFSNKSTILHCIWHFPTNFFEKIVNDIGSNFDFNYANLAGDTILHFMARDFYNPNFPSVKYNFLTLLNSKFITKINLNLHSHSLYQDTFWHIIFRTLINKSFNKYDQFELISIIKKTQKLGADIFLKNNQNKTLLDLSKLQNLNLVTEYLEEEFAKNENKKINTETEIKLGDFVKLKQFTDQYGFIVSLKRNGTQEIQAEVAMNGIYYFIKTIPLNLLQKSDKPVNNQLSSGDYIYDYNLLSEGLQIINQDECKYEITKKSNEYVVMKSLHNLMQVSYKRESLLDHFWVI